MDDIEFDPPTFFPCACCGNTTTQLTRFVRREGSAYAVYYAGFTDGPNHDHANILIGLGNWGEDGVDPVQERAAFACRLWRSAGSWNVTVINPDDTPWSTTFLGQRLSRDEALAHPWLPEVFALTDHMVLCDEALKAHFQA